MWLLRVFFPNTTLSFEHAFFVYLEKVIIERGFLRKPVCAESRTQSKMFKSRRLLQLTFEGIPPNSFAWLLSWRSLSQNDSRQFFTFGFPFSPISVCTKADILVFNLKSFFDFLHPVLGCQIYGEKRSSKLKSYYSFGDFVGTPFLLPS